MIDKITPQSCTLCGSCVSVCPQKAIAYTRHHLDFSYPEINCELCVKCNLCERACPVLKSSIVGAENDFQPHAFVGRCTDLEIRKGSSSGGIFWMLAETVLQQGGYVGGAVFDNEFAVHHIVSNKREIVRQMMGSKYAQSDASKSFPQIKQLLVQGYHVLFSGCPCQIAGLKSYLGSVYTNLTTIDVVCHGIPSKTMLHSYLSVQEQKHNARIKTISFRDKSYGWHRSAVKIEFTNGKSYIKPIGNDAYMSGFLGATFLKESCYQCQFKNYRSGSDITLGDFWGAETLHPELDDNGGLSAIIVNSKKGEKILGQIACELWPESLDSIEKYNRNLVYPTKMNPIRSVFYQWAEANGYEAAIKKFFWERPYMRFYRVMRYWLRCALYKICGRGKPLY